MRPDDRRYRQSHEWAKLDGELVIVGITDFAVAELNDLVYLDMPEVGKVLEAGDEFGEVESVKAVSALYAPVSGTVEAVNSPLEDDLDALASDPFESGWIIKIRPTDASQIDGLLSAADYDKGLEA